MSFAHINIDKFAGLNSTVAPELIDDGAARDIYNFRMEKIGKLVSRNGYIFGLFHKHTLHIDKTMKTDAVERYAINRGIIGIGEIILSGTQELWQTDRFMAYVIRSEENEDYDTIAEGQPGFDDLMNTQRYKLCYLFSPVEGQYANWLVTNETTGVQFVPIDKMDETPQGVGTNTVQLYAPNRNDDVTLPAGDEDHWIKHYQVLTQYDNSLVISDRINGDMILEDEANRGQFADCNESEHSLRLRPNCLESCDIDAFEFSPRFGEGQENDSDEGIETGMALYKFKLPKKVQKVTRDNFANTIGNKDWTGFTDPDPDINFNNYRKAVDHMESGAASTMIMLFHRRSGDGNTNRVYCNINNDLHYVFSNADSSAEFDDIFGNVELGEDEYKNEEGKLVTERSADVYVWEDYKLKYYLSHGINQDGGYFLRDLDRVFNKLDPGIPRILKLSAKTLNGQTAPLGVWRYRFAWDFGDGIYSAPSAEILCPDMLFSATKDGEFEDSSAYQRPSQQNIPYANPNDIAIDNSRIGYEHSCIVSQIGSPYDPLINPANKSLLITPPILQSDMILTDFGEKFFNLKKEVYGDINHRFGTKDWADITEFNSLTGQDRRRQVGDLGVQITAFFAKNNLKMKGFIWEGCGLCSSTSEYAERDVRVIHGSGQLLVPIFQSPGAEHTYNSVFDDYGRYRLAYLTQAEYPPGVNYGPGKDWPGFAAFDGVTEWDTPSSPYYRRNVNRQLVMPNYNTGIGYGTQVTGFTGEHWWKYELLQSADATADEDLDSNDPNMYLNFACLNDGYYGGSNISLAMPAISTGSLLNDYNNDSYDDLWNGFERRNIRPNMIFRAVQQEADHIINTNAGLPAEALSRLFVSGIAELHLTEPGNKIDLAAKWLREGTDNTHSLNTLERGNYRIGGVTWGWDDTEDDWVYRYSTNKPYDINEQHPDKPIQLDTYIYGEAHRFLGVEQLTAYFPTSVLFGSPRMGIKIKNADIPRRAKRLLVFRTLSSHNNAFQPNEYGLVDTVEINRVTQDDVDNGLYSASELGMARTEDVISVINDAGSITVAAFNALTSGSEGDQYTISDVGVLVGGENTTAGDIVVIRETFSGSIQGYYYDFYESDSTEDRTKAAYHGIYYFDEIKDALLDMGQTPQEYEGLRKPIKSRFNIALNERMYYLNFEEEYQPIAPRKWENPVGSDELPDTSHYVMDSLEGKGFDTSAGGIQVQYAYVYKDLTGLLSQPILTGLIDIASSAELQSVVLYYMPSTFDNNIEKILIYRKITGVKADQFYLVGSVLPEDEGVFVDNNLPNGALLDCTEPTITNYPSGVRYSEPYRPDWIKADSFVEYRSGDGKQITGAQSLYGNLLVFKETSIHRAAVQDNGAIISRTDEVSPDVGCVAPNSCININNLIFFLSNKGFMAYNNNTLEKIDGAFSEELQFILQTYPAAFQYIRDVTAGYNPAYNEIYLNIPMLPTGTDLELQREYGEADMYRSNSSPDAEYYKRRLYGHIYVINRDKGYVTKFGYQPSIDPMNNSAGNLRSIYDVRQLIRLYYNNSRGQLRSADIFPAFHWGLGAGVTWAGIYIETPYNLDYRTPLLTDTDHVINSFIFYDGSNYDHTTEIFPPYLQSPVKSIFKSKFFTGGDETLIKRVRKAIFNIYSRGGIILKAVSIFKDSDVYLDAGEPLGIGMNGDARIENRQFPELDETFTYNPTDNSRHPITSVTTPGTGTNIISFIPNNPVGDILDATGQVNPLIDINDWLAKPVRFSVEIETNLRSQINEIALYWRPIHSYLS